MGRDTFETLVTLLQTPDSDWSAVHYYVFDAPMLEEPYEKRLAFLHQMEIPSHVRIAETTQCRSMQHMNQVLTSVCHNGGEGIVAKDPQALYSPGRTQALLQIKVKFVFTSLIVRCTTIAKFVSLKCCPIPSNVCSTNYAKPNSDLFRANRVMCSVGFMGERPAPMPPVGSIITVKHSGEYNHGRLKQPIFWRQCPDF